MIEPYVYAIAALLPLAAGMVILQVNPYHALVMRGILGAIAALLYAILGAADVALTEALVGTLLAITLYAIAVRSSLVVRVGVWKDEVFVADQEPDSLAASHFNQLIGELKMIFRPYHLRVELVPYPDREDLHQALLTKDVHITYLQSTLGEEIPQLKNGNQPTSYALTTRLRRLHEILQADWEPSLTQLTYCPSD
jgi:putative multicomponent Na+:H+ antiporter subunit B